MNNQLAPVTWQTLAKKSLIWGIWLFFLAIIQTSFFSVLRPFGAVPDMVLTAVIVIAIYDKERTGTIAGLTGGFIADALGSTGLSFSPLVYMICGCITAILAYSVLRRDFISWIIGTVLSLIISGIASIISLYSSASASHVGFSHILTELLIPQFLASLVIGIPVYIVTKMIWSRFFNNREMEG